MIYFNEKIVEFGQFPNMEINLGIGQLAVKKQNIIKFIYNNDADIFKLVLLKSYLDRHSAKTYLYICYMPYSRMDRENGIYVVSLDCMSKLINDMDFQHVYIREPHSKATMDSINNSTADWWCKERLQKVIDISGATSVFFPDKGAQDRYKYNVLPTAVGTKTRDFSTGKIEEYGISGIVNKDVLIVDDLCSKGGTFIRAASLLKEEGAKRISLLVAYCENNVFNGDLFSHITMLYTSEESLDYPHPHPQITKLH